MGRNALSLGDVRLDPNEGLAPLSRHAAAALGVRHCCLITQKGVVLPVSARVGDCGLTEGCVNHITAAARSANASVYASKEGAAFAAVKRDGSVVTWGHPDWGGDSTAVRYQVGAEVEQVAGTRGAFAAVKRDGSVVTVQDQLTWGLPGRGGDSDA